MKVRGEMYGQDLYSLASSSRVFSFQFLGAASLPRPWPWLPDVGDFTGVCHPKLRIHCLTPRFGENTAVPLWRSKGSGGGTRVQRFVLTTSALENCFLRPPRDPFSRLNPLRSEALPNGSREDQLACGEVHVLHDDY